MFYSQAGPFYSQHSSFKRHLLSTVMALSYILTKQHGTSAKREMNMQTLGYTDVKTLTYRHRLIGKQLQTYTHVRTHTHIHMHTIYYKAKLQIDTYIGRERYT